MSLGKQGEEIAANYLKNKGFRVLERNFRCRLGEIDIVAAKGKCLVFVEVKTRNSLKYGMPCEAVTPQKLAHIAKTAQFYLLKNHIKQAEQRIDVIEILCIGEKAYIRHTENVS